MNVLVTGAGGASGISTILALKKCKDVKIFACDCNKYSSGLHLADKKFTVSSASKEEKFLKKIIGKVKEHNIDLIFPNVDEELLVFAKNKSEIPCNIIISSEETVDICNDKSKLISTLEGTVPLPSLEDISPPYLVKPKIGRGSRNIYKVEDEEEKDALFDYLEQKGLDKNELLTQEFLPGKEYTVDALFNKEREVVVAIPRERIRTFGGASFVGRTEKDDELIHSVREISKELNFFGPVNLQFKNDEDGTAKLIEINPRCSGGMAITTKSGVNIPRLTIDIVKDRSISEESINWEEETVFRYLTEV